MMQPKTIAIVSTLVLAGLLAGCKKQEVQAPAVAPASTIKVEPSAGGGPIVVTTSAAEFLIFPSGAVQAALLKDGAKLSLDTLSPDANYLVSNKKDIRFTLDLANAKVSEATGKMGRGKHIEIPAQAAATGVQLTLQADAYDEFPNILLSSAQYKNTGTAEVKVDNVVAQQHRFDSRVAGKPYEMWSYQGASYDWGEDDVVKLAKNFSRPNAMGEVVKGGYGGGIPVVAFWNGSVGEAIGHIETVPLTLSVPVDVQGDGFVKAAVEIPANTTLKPGESFATPRTFVAVYRGDFYQPLHLWSRVLQKEGWEIPKPSDEAYNISWCGWGYESDVTPAQMLGTIPKLKEMKIKWATLDDRWFNNYGDWAPRSDTFPGDSIKTLADDFHKQGMLVQLWWLPIAVEDGQGKWDHPYGIANVVKEHPEWLILDKNGKHARMTRNLAALCPAVPEVQAYFKKLTETFIRDWGYDGHKLDNIYTVPACYNPAHHHKSPQDSVNAVADVYKVIFQTTRALKPESVTQSCPCGTPPSLAWLPYMDQAVTADPVGAVQVRYRIKMYKALLGPESAVYGDHVELSAMTRVGKGWSEHGDDFASTIGTGGVVGTKFVWPDPGPKFKAVNLTSDKDAHWKKWIDLYNQKMLSKGTFLDLYTFGYDTPEGYAISKDGKMYYAFFAPDGTPWKGEVELRGLQPGTYHVTDYAEGKDLGTVEVTSNQPARLKAEFSQHLLLEVSK
ncbi:MAG: alpha-galactosidase [Acidobacteria bacterium]|nr:alpha-galactosidase [Acidobacteriota bacterium]